jgi:hypothetical protein
VDFGVLVFVVFLAFCLFMVFRKRNAIVLSTQELSQIIGLPTAIAKLPVALGKVPAARMQLGSKQAKKTKKAQENKEASFDKKETETGEQKQEHNNSGLPLPSSCCLSGGLEDDEGDL